MRESYFGEKGSGKKPLLLKQRAGQVRKTPGRGVIHFFMPKKSGLCGHASGRCCLFPAGCFCSLSLPQGRKERQYHSLCTKQRWFSIRRYAVSGKRSSGKHTLVAHGQGEGARRKGRFCRRECVAGWKRHACCGSLSLWCCASAGTAARGSVFRITFKKERHSVRTGEEPPCVFPAHGGVFCQETSALRAGQRCMKPMICPERMTVSRE